MLKQIDALQVMNHMWSVEVGHFSAVVVKEPAIFYFFAHVQYDVIWHISGYYFLCNQMITLAVVAKFHIDGESSTAYLKHGQVA